MSASAIPGGHNYDIGGSCEKHRIVVKVTFDKKNRTAMTITLVVVTKKYGPEHLELTLWKQSEQSGRFGLGLVIGQCIGPVV